MDGASAEAQQQHQRHELQHEGGRAGVGVEGKYIERWVDYDCSGWQAFVTAVNHSDLRRLLLRGCGLGPEAAYHLAKAEIGGKVREGWDWANCVITGRFRNLWFNVSEFLADCCAQEKPKKNCAQMFLEPIVPPATSLCTIGSKHSNILKIAGN